MAKKTTIKITQKDIDKIIPPAKSREEAIALSKKYEMEYEQSKKEILDIMKRNLEKYKEQ